MRKIIVLLFILPFVSNCSTVSSATPLSKLPNILWIYTEDLSPFMGCYGNEVNKNHTPVIDKLASEGVLFKKCFMPAPVCSATRSAIITGVMQTTTGTHGHRSARTPDSLYYLPKHITTLPELMRAKGYFTFNNGKDDYNFTYDRRKLYNSGTKENYKYKQNGWQGCFGKGSWRDRKDKSQPFFGQIQIWGGKSQIRKTPKSDRLSPSDISVPPYFANTLPFQKDWAYHHNTSRETDYDVKRILQDLKNDDLLDNTIVFFFSDHGNNKSLRGKQFCYDEGLHVPLIIRGNHAKLKAGSVRNELVSGLDITATTLALAEVKLPEYLDGQDLFGSHYKEREYVISARDRCDYTIDRIRTVRSEKFRYIRNFMPERNLLQPQYRDGSPAVKEFKKLRREGKLSKLLDDMYFGLRPDEELYDVEKDPYMVNNLAKSSTHSAELKKHRDLLNKWIKETDDKGQYPEDSRQLKATYGLWKSKCVNPEYDQFKK